ncbi:tripartite tricarboxylate transporter substrate binding protein [Variovorax sp. J22R133]|uniref:Bug family tripartite tricarboxylate transporter substrate binding protein n=1 Tax=Variovorax brevis TaxID=3053503 RepID=UPI002577AFBC|nr:tripartite tricarboxylate transporter substrate binding protein [Variovorax sp. J22R133]MDM0117608.1 tripartite tricarboxylate transporter substrate binding protein [Variovorax sp. J22R133]
MKSRRRIIVAATALAALASAPAWAQAAKGKFPDRLIRIVVPFAAGGGVDSMARLLANQLTTQFGVAVIVENRAGANGMLGGKAVQTSPADGYTLLFSAATHVLAKQVMSNASYDPQTDFAPVARVGEAPLMLVISPQLEPRKLGDVLKAAKEQPDKWSAAIPASGAPSHLATLLLAKQGNVKLTYVAYKGTQPALVDVAGGHVQLLLDSIISVHPLAKSGRVRPIAITASKRSPLAPDVPTAQESGFPGLTYASWYGVWAPKDTPPDRVKFLNTTINSAVAELAKSGALVNLGIEPVAQDPEQFRQYIASYVAQSADLLKGAGFKPE